MGAATRARAGGVADDVGDVSRVCGRHVGTAERGGCARPRRPAAPQWRAWLCLAVRLDCGRPGDPSQVGTVPLLSFQFRFFLSYNRLLTCCAAAGQQDRCARRPQLSAMQHMCAHQCLQGGTHTHTRANASLSFRECGVQGADDADVTGGVTREGARAEGTANGDAVGAHAAASGRVGNHSQQLHVPLCLLRRYELAAHLLRSGQPFRHSRTSLRCPKCPERGNVLIYSTQSCHLRQLQH